MAGQMELSIAPWIGVLIMAAVTLRVNGWLSDELLAELKNPFSRTTLMTVSTLTIVIAQIFWLGSKL